MKELFESSYLYAMSELNEKLNEENKQLKETIDKAIKFLEDDDIEVTSVKYNDINDVTKQLLEILKGDE